MAAACSSPTIRSAEGSHSILRPSRTAMLPRWQTVARAVADLDVADRPLAALDAVEEVLVVVCAHVRDGTSDAESLAFDDARRACS